MIVAALFTDAFGFIPAHISLLLEKTWQTAELAFTALAIALVLSMPLGLWLGHRHKGLGFALGASTVGRALPVIVVIGSMPSGLITALIIFFGIRQAMRMTAAPVLRISGPFRIGASPSAPTTA